MQLSDIRARVSQRLNEGVTGPVFYPAAEINAAINEGNRLFCLLTLGLETTASWTPGAATTHMLGVFADWITVLRITDSAGAAVRLATLAELNSLDPNWIASTGSPARYVSLGADLIGVYGTSGTLKVVYARAPVSLAADGDVPEIPAEYHPHLIEFAIYRCRQIEGAQEFAKSLKYFAAFMDGADRYAKFVRARNVGARYDKVPFELRSFDRSKILGLRPDLLPPATLTPQGDGTVPMEVK